LLKAGKSAPMEYQNDLDEEKERKEDGRDEENKKE